MESIVNAIFGLGSSLGGIVIIILILSLALKIVPEYQRLVVFRLGRLWGAKGPGLAFVLPWIDRTLRVDLRVVTLDVPVQEVITKDNVPIKVNAVVYFRVLNPSKSMVEVEDYIVRMTSHTTARTSWWRQTPSA